MCVCVCVCLPVVFLCSPIINFNYIIYVLFFPFSPSRCCHLFCCPTRPKKTAQHRTTTTTNNKIETQHKMFLFFPFVKKKTRLCRSLFSLFLCTRKLCRLTKIAHCYCSFLPHPPRLFVPKLIRRLRTGLRCSRILQAHTMPQLGRCLLVCGQAWRRVCQHTHTWQAQLR